MARPMTSRCIDSEPSGTARCVIGLAGGVETPVRGIGPLGFQLADSHTPCVW